jgi:hypothetical protein
MDNSASNNPQPDNRDASTPANGKADEPLRLQENPATASPGVSRAPLNLGGGSAAPAPPATATPAPVAKPAARAAAVRPAPRPPVPAVRPAPPRPPAGERICACKVFFTKLHPGAIKFLEEQITNWLKENPSVAVKSTNVIMGEVQEKKTEPNILVVVWY